METKNYDRTDFRELRIWQVGVELSVTVYTMTKTFPPHEQFGLASQMQRAAVSVPSNIAEGYSQYLERGTLKYLRFARGSLSELETQIVIATAIGYIPPDISEQALLTCRKLRTMIAKFSRAISSTT